MKLNSHAHTINTTRRESMYILSLTSQGERNAPNANDSHISYLPLAHMLERVVHVNHDVIFNDIIVMSYYIIHSV